MTTTLTDRPKTLPAVALEAGEPLDGLRAFLRKRDDLKMLGVKVGPLFVYGSDAIRTILDEFRRTRGKSAA